MTSLLLLLLKTSSVLAIGLLAMPFLRRGSAAARHVVLATAMTIAMLVPVLALVAPGWGNPVGTSPLWAPAVDRGAGLTVWCWIAGAILQLTSLAAGMVRLVWVSWRAERCDHEGLNDLALEIIAEYRVSRPVALLTSDCPLAPLTWGYFRPVILLPAEASMWDRERARVVLRHELAHVRRHDWLTHVLSLAVRSRVGWHPLVWMACARLRRESEYACDAHVVSSGVPSHRYALHLLELARGYGSRAEPASLPAPAIASRSILESRVRTMLDPRTSRTTTVGIRTRALATAAFVSAGLVVAGYGSEPQWFRGPLVVFTPEERPITLTLLLDGRLVDLSKGVPPRPDTSSGLVNGTTFARVGSHTN
jgi:hypothetical protein